MPNYSPPPKNLDGLNPIQRYMQKGERSWGDYIGLIAIVAGYFMLRPYIEKAAKWWFSDAKLIEGEKAQRGYEQRRAKAKIGANTIRSGKPEEETTIEEITEDAEVAASGSKVNNTSTVVNRKTKPQTNSKKSTVDQLVDWDDEPMGGKVEGGKADVVDWLSRWDKEVEN